MTDLALVSPDPAGTTSDASLPEGDAPEKGSLLTQDIAPEKDAPSSPTEPEAGDSAATEKSAEGASSDEPKGPPDEYADFTVPEGVELDASAVEKFKVLAKGAGLTQEAAQGFVDAAIELQASWLSALVAEQQATVKAWKTAVQTDPELGGDKLAPSLAVAKRALDQVRDVPGFTELLDQSGLGNHPAVVKAFYRLGSLLSEDTFVNGDTAGNAKPKSLAELLYTHPKSA